MKINEIIKTKRIEAGFTQEKVAEYLGVTAPAVNKWEKGVSFPDITLLPPLARLLGVDLNTLLSFNDDLTDGEIGMFLNDISNIIKEKDYKTGFSLAMDKIKEYPTCDRLISNVALLLEGGISLFSYFSETEIKYYQNEIFKLYERVLCSKDEDMRIQVSNMLISKYIKKEDFEKAEELMDNIPEYSLNSKVLRSNLYLKRGDSYKALEVLQSTLMKLINDILTLLFHMADISFLNKEYDKSEYYSEVSKKTVKLFDLWEYNSYVIEFQIAVYKKNVDKSIEVLDKMLPSMLKSWDIKNSMLYGNVKINSSKDDFGKGFIDILISDVKNDSELSYLNESKKFWDLIKKYYNK